jgi:hypothetical protein
MRLDIEYSVYVSIVVLVYVLVVIQHKILRGILYVSDAQ